MDTEFFKGPKLLVARARKHIESLNDSGKAFAETKPYAVSCEFDDATKEYVYKVGIRETTPDSFSLDVADALNNLKSSLDQAICASVNVLFPAKTLSGVYFPFSDIAAHFDGAVRLGLKKAAPEIVTLVRELKPYRDGNYLLWLMNRLSKVNRHRVLQPVSLAGENAFGINNMVLSGGGKIMAPFWDHAKKELIFARTLQPNLQYDLDFSFHIAFGKDEFVGGQPAIPLLSRIADEIERAVMSIESETLRVARSRP